MSRLLAKYRQDEERERAYRNVARAIRESAETINLRTDPLLPADPTDLRGIPCLAPGVGGTSPGTDPFLAVSARGL
jgi:hypothetical protein